MKKLILVLTVTVGCLAAHAQVKFGLISGLNIANFKTDYPQKPIIAAGNIFYYAGCNVDDKLSRQLSIYLGVEYMVEGSSVNDLSDSYVPTGKYTLKYLSSPLQVKYRITPIFFLETGPEIEVLLSGKVDHNETLFSSGTSEFSTINFGWRLGCGFFVTKDFGIDFHYLYGFTNVANNQSNANLANRIIQMGIYYWFK